MSKIEMIIPCFHIPSVNELYLHNAQTGDMYKNPETVRMIDQMRTFMSDHYKLSQIDGIFHSGQPIEIRYDFILNKSLWRRDLSNMIKCVQDIVTRYIGLDDSHVFSIYARKSLIKGNALEYINCTITNEINPDVPNSKETIIIPVKYIPSLNNMYDFDCKSKQVFKTKHTIEFQNKVSSYIVDNTNLQRMPYIKNRRPLKFHYDFYLSSLCDPAINGVRKSRDVDNMIKSAEDGIFKFLPSDDRYVIELYARKHYKPDIKSEYLAFHVEESLYDTSSFSK